MGKKAKSSENSRSRKRGQNSKGKEKSDAHDKISLLMNKYRSILGTKEPIVVLQDIKFGSKYVSKLDTKAEEVQSSEKDKLTKSKNISDSSSEEIFDTPPSGRVSIKRKKRKVTTANDCDDKHKREKRTRQDYVEKKKSPSRKDSVRQTRSRNKVDNSVKIKYSPSAKDADDISNVTSSVQCSSKDKWSKNDFKYEYITRDKNSNIICSSLKQEKQSNRHKVKRTNVKHSRRISSDSSSSSSRDVSSTQSCNKRKRNNSHENRSKSSQQRKLDYTSSSEELNNTDTDTRNAPNNIKDATVTPETAEMSPKNHSSSMQHCAVESCKTDKKLPVIKQCIRLQKPVKLTKGKDELIELNSRDSLCQKPSCSAITQDTQNETSVIKSPNETSVSQQAIPEEATKLLSLTVDNVRICTTEKSETECLSGRNGDQINEKRPRAQVEHERSDQTSKKRIKLNRKQLSPYTKNSKTSEHDPKKRTNNVSSNHLLELYLNTLHKETEHPTQEQVSKPNVETINSFGHNLNKDNQAASTETPQEETISEIEAPAEKGLESENTVQSDVSQTDQNEENSMNPTTAENSNDDSDDGCISLFAESIFAEEFKELEKQPQTTNTKKHCKLQSTNKSYVMNDKMFDAYVKNITTEFNNEYQDCSENNNNNISSNLKSAFDARRILDRKKSIPFKQPSEKCNTPVLPNEDITGTNNSILMDLAMENVNDRTRINIGNLIQGYCYKNLKRGSCKGLCKYKHNYETLIAQLQNESWETVSKVMTYLMHCNFYHFLQEVYMQLMPKMDCNKILNIYLRLYNRRLLKEKIVFFTVELLISKNISVKETVNRLVQIHPDDSKFHYPLFQAVQNYLETGQLWETVKDALLKIKQEQLPIFVIHNVLRECIEHKNNLAPDIYKNLINSLGPLVFSQIDKRLLKQFKDLLRSSDTSDALNLGVQENENVPSVNLVPNIYAVIPGNLEKQARRSAFLRLSNKQGQSPSQVPFTITRADELPKSNSVHDRDELERFRWDLKNLQEGFKQQNYDRIISVLTKAATEYHSSSFTRACYRILYSEIRHTQYHLSNIISMSVQMDNSVALKKILYDVALYILTSLADEGYWVLAYRLLKDLKVFFYIFDAAFIILSAEIYIANQQAVKAFILLKQSNIIYTNRTKWKVTNTAKDDYLRAKVISILLDALSGTSVEYAFYLFQFLVKDQTSNFYPIDLTLSVNKITSMLLLKNNVELVVQCGRSIIDFHFGLNTITYRALIASLVDIDMNLAKQLYRIAIDLGIYSEMKFSPVIYTVINADWTIEEIYLAFLELFHQLSLAIGVGIDHIRGNSLTVHLLFEIEPMEKHPCFDTEERKTIDPKIIRSNKIVETLLQERFDPPILLRKGSRGRLRKIQIKSLVNYLQSGHCN